MNLRKGLLVLFAIAGMLGLAGSAQAQSTPAAQTPAAQTPSGVTIARVYYVDRAQLADLTTHYDVWEVRSAEGYAVVAVSQAEYAALSAQGYRVSIDLAKTIEANLPRTYLPGQTNGIPGYTCYRTVEETYTTAQNIVAVHPSLAEWIDIGDSWDKITAGGNPGYDLMVLKLTNQAMPGPKPKLFVMSAIHAREYTTAETNTRFAEYLVNNYGVDPDATWLLDYNEIHLLLQSNPDGRKMAEGGQLWRKNVDNNYCTNTTSRGADLNRNYPFHWGGPGASTNQCDETYRGASAASEPETQAVVNYVRSQYPDLRNDDLISAAPITTSGIFMDLHSYAQLVLWPWGDTSQAAPNGPAMQTLGRKFAYFNNYTPEQSVGLYPTSGTTDDTAYGELGVPAYTIEMGVDFFESCASFESTTYPENFPALLYAAKATRRPYQTPAGPDVLNLSVTPTTTLSGAQVILSATANDTRFNNINGTEPSQNIAAARYTIDEPSWLTGVISYPLSATDGVFNTSIEAINATISTTGLSLGRHTLFVEAQDAAGNWGVPTAVFFQVNGVPDSGLTGSVLTLGSGVPIEGASVQASAGPTATFNTMSDASGAYALNVLAGNYTLTASKYGYQPATINNVPASAGFTTTQAITLAAVPFHSVSGTVKDGLTGWPLAAAIDIGGYPNSPIGTNPATGVYGLSLAEGITYTFNVNANVPGYLPQTRPVGPLTADRVEDFNLAVDQQACTAPGYAFAGIYQAFESGSVPAGWTVINNVGSAGWAFNDPGARGNLTGGAGGFAVADSDAAGSGVSMNTELRTPVMDLSSLSAVTLTFKTDFHYYTTEVADVDVSVNGAAGPWTNVWHKSGADYRGPKSEAINLTALAAGHNNVMVRFHYYNAVYEWWWQVDDVQLGQCLASTTGLPAMSPATASQSGVPGATVTYTLQLTNIGDLTDTFVLNAANYAWPTDWEPISTTLSPNESVGAIVSVTIPLTVTESATDTALLTLTGAKAAAQSVITTTANVPHGVPALSPATASQVGQPGSTVTYTLAMSNAGTITDTFALSVSGNAWPTSFAPVTTTLAPSQTAGLIVSVTIPLSAPGNALDSAVINLGGSGLAAHSQLTTTATVQRGVQIEAAQLTHPGGVGEEVTYSLQLTNTGNLTDTFTLNAGGNLWPTVVTPISTTLAAFAATPITVTVSVPLTATADLTDTVRITAQGTGVSDYRDLITIVIPTYKVLLPLMWKD